MLSKISLSKDFKTISIILCLGFFSRAIALIFSSTTDGDAVERIYIAWRWLENPQIITHGVWLPLHTYLLAGVMWLFQDQFFAPIALNIVFSVATAIPLYFFTKNEFGEKYSWFVSCAFLFCPLAFVNSLMALSETTFTFFVAVSLYFVSQARKNYGTWHHALFAGLSLTLAAHTRYEGWILIPLLGILLWKKPQILVVFLTTSLISPIFWLLASYINYGNALYSIQYQQQDTQVVGEELKQQLLKRILFVPIGLFLGMSVVVPILSVWGAVVSLVQRKASSVWLIPFVGLCFVLIFKSVSGSLNLLYRYNLTPSILILPFCVEAINYFPIINKNKYFKIMTIISMIPISYFNPSSLKGIQIIPQKNQEIIGKIKESLNPEKDRLILVGLPWTINKQIAFNSALKPDKIGLSFGLNPTDPIDVGWDMEQKRKTLKEFLQNNLYSGGIIVIEQKKMSSNVITLIENNQLNIDNVAVKIVQKIGENEDVLIYKYQTFPSKSIFH